MNVMGLMSKITIIVKSGFRNDLLGILVGLLSKI